MMQAFVHVGPLKALRDKVKDLLPGGAGYDRIMRTVATDTLAAMKKRIHQDGLAADGGDIGRYDKTHPLYVNPNNSPISFTPLGKGQTKAKKAGAGYFSIKSHKEVMISVRESGKPRMTRYFESYDAFKSFIGRNPGKVNLSLTGGLNNQFVVIGDPNSNGYGLGWINDDFFKRAKALEHKYSKQIWALTAEEKKQVIQVAEFEVSKIFN